MIKSYIFLDSKKKSYIFFEIISFWSLHELCIQLYFIIDLVSSYIKHHLKKTKLPNEITTILLSVPV